MATPRRSLPDLFYSASGFWLRAGSRFLPVDKGDLENLCAHQRVLDGHTIKDTPGLTTFQTLKARVITEHFADYAGPLAGHRVGCFETTDGRKILVTTEPRDVFAEPGKKGAVDFFMGFIDGLLGAESEAKLWFLAWLKLATEALREGTFKPGQMAVFAGPAECGKSFALHLITELLGGRVAKPYKWMTGETAFNQDLAQAESLVIDDEASHRDIRSRRAFGQMIKQLTALESFDIHGKGKMAITLPTFRRLSGAFNMEADDLLVLPPMALTETDSIIGKIGLLRCGHAQLSEDRGRNKAALARELPAIRRWLADFTVPKSWANKRFGVKAWHDPELLERVAELSPESSLLSLIDDHLNMPWTGSATKLETELCNAEKSAARLFHHTSACGQMLARLAAKLPARFKQTRSDGKTRWTITK